jgi:hypothetical protein
MARTTVVVRARQRAGRSTAAVMGLSKTIESRTQSAAPRFAHGRRCGALRNRLASATPEQLDDARRLRKAILETGSLINEGKSPNRRAVAVINEFAALPQPKLQLDYRSWRPEYLTDAPIDAGLSAVTRDAIGTRIRVVGDNECTTAQTILKQCEDPQVKHLRPIE